MSLIFTQAFNYLFLSTSLGFILYSPNILNWQASLLIFTPPSNDHFSCILQVLMCIRMQFRSKYFVNFIISSSTHKLLKVLTGFFVWLISNFLLWSVGDILFSVFFLSLYKVLTICVCSLELLEKTINLYFICSMSPTPKPLRCCFRASLGSFPRAGNLPNQSGSPRMLILLRKEISFVFEPLDIHSQFSFSLFELAWH